MESADRCGPLSCFDYYSTTSIRALPSMAGVRRWTLLAITRDSPSSPSRVARVARAGPRAVRSRTLSVAQLRGARAVRLVGRSCGVAGCGAWVGKPTQKSRGGRALGFSRYNTATTATYDRSYHRSRCRIDTTGRVKSGKPGRHEMQTDAFRSSCATYLTDSRVLSIARDGPDVRHPTPPTRYSFACDQNAELLAGRLIRVANTPIVHGSQPKGSRAHPWACP